MSNLKATKMFRTRNLLNNKGLCTHEWCSELLDMSPSHIPSVSSIWPSPSAEIYLTKTDLSSLPIVPRFLSHPIHPPIRHYSTQNRPHTANFTHRSTPRLLHASKHKGNEANKSREGSGQPKCDGTRAETRSRLSRETDESI